MIAPWIFELLRRERDWRAALPRIAAHLSELPEDRVRAGLELGAAFEHVEPDRYHAITAYQLAGARRDRGRSRKLAVEIGWWQAEGRLALVELQASGAAEALIAACRALIDDNKLDAAKKLFAEHGSDSPALDGLRAELDGRTGEWVTFASSARKQRGSAAADAYVTAARLARTGAHKEWLRFLEAALEADPQHDVACAMLMDVAVAREDDSLVFEVMRIRLLGLDGYEYSDGLRAIATRLLLAEPTHHAGMGRRLAKVAIERAYAAELIEIPGHLALWSLIDSAAAQDGTRTELLPLILRALDSPIPDFDRTWLAALGAAICIEAGSSETARSYAAIVAEQASSHPVVLDLLVEAEETDGVDLSDDIEFLEEDATPPPIDLMVPDDLGIDLGRVTMAKGSVISDDGPRALDPRFVDVRVRALDDPPLRAKAEPKPAATPALAATLAAKPNAMIQTTPSPVPAAPPQDTTLDEAWDVDDSLFPRRRRSTQMPAMGTAADAAPEKPADKPADMSAARPVEKPAAQKPAATPAEMPAGKPAAEKPAAKPAEMPAAKPAVTPVAKPTAEKPAVKPAATLIPAAAKAVLQQSGAPRPLPKVPSPANAKPRADRVPISIDIVIRFGDKSIRVHTRDLSTSGFFGITSETFEIGLSVECDLRIPSPDETGAQTHTARARIVRKDTNGFGFWFLQPAAGLVKAISEHLAR